MQLPDLRILPLEALTPHERTDPRRVNPLIERLRHEAVLRNPPIVAPFNGNGNGTGNGNGGASGNDASDDRQRYVVLDGANRTTAFRALGVPHVVAQVVPYEQVQLNVWHHVITACDVDDLLEQIGALEGLTLRRSDLMSARAALARREALAFISLDSREDGPLPTDQGASANRQSKIANRPTSTPRGLSVVVSGGRDLVSRTELLNQLVDLYEGCAKVQRTTSDSIVEARRTFPDASAIVVFPRYEPAEIIDLARSEVRLPAGITRHVLPLRALRLDYPMDILRSDEPIAKKQGHLSGWIYDKVQARQVRMYSEPTVMFDE